MLKIIRANKGLGKEYKALRQEFITAQTKLENTLQQVRTFKFHWSKSKEAEGIRFRLNEWIGFQDPEGRQWRMILTESTQVYDKFIYECNAGVLIPMHHHPDFTEVIRLDAGELELIVDNKVIQSPIGREISIAPYISHSGIYRVQSRCTIWRYWD
jgi:hypothetical protein